MNSRGQLGGMAGRPMLGSAMVGSYQGIARPMVPGRAGTTPGDPGPICGIGHNQLLCNLWRGEYGGGMWGVAGMRSPSRLSSPSLLVSPHLLLFWSLILSFSSGLSSSPSLLVSPLFSSLHIREGRVVHGGWGARWDMGTRGGLSRDLSSNFDTMNREMHKNWV